jgi:cyclopropane fatty-acyl-phospholipid synthase-like methyltransferase
MTRRAETLAAGYFDALYASNPDPWRFASSEYEAAKYAATMVALPSQEYRRALEIGCSIGVLTRQLSSRCQTLLALDAAEAALSHARERCRELHQISFLRALVPAEWPEGVFDLVLLSEVVYYLNRDDVERLVKRVEVCTREGADIVLVHWLGSTDYPLSGDEAADLFIRRSSAFAQVCHQERADHYRIDVLRVVAGP